MEFEHVSVLLNETIEHLNIKPNGIYVDGTLGGGGHASKICEQLGEEGIFIGIDQDQDALRAAEEKLKEYKPKKIFVHNNFSNIKQILQQINIPYIDGMMMDLGVSSYQLDEAKRGFSYMHNGDLDMRMDQSQGFSAKDIVNEYTEEELYRIIKDYGEERWAKRIAKFIVDKRTQKRIDTTYELVEIIKSAVPKAKRRNGPHPAKRTFQAIRIEVNNELGILKDTVKDIGDCLNKDGRICVITFHSLEDRIIKNIFRDLSITCICPPKAPICTCNHQALLKRITKKPILPTEEEIEKNPRSRSAKLRVAQKV